MITHLAIVLLAQAPLLPQETVQPDLFDHATKALLGFILGLLGIAYLVGQLIRRQPESGLLSAGSIAR